jgi:AraC-like DNA-binding protein
VKTHFLGPFLLWLEGEGYPVEDWLARRGVETSIVGALEWHLPHATYCEILAIAEANARNSALGLAFAQSTVRMYAFMEALWQNCPNIDGVLQTWSYYDKVMPGRMSFSLTEHDGTISVRQRCDEYDLALERLSNEFLIAWFFRQIRALSGVPVVPLELAFAHSAPRDVEPYVELFGTTNIVFGDGENRLVFDDRVRALPVLLADGRVYSALVEHASAPRNPSEPPRALVERLHEAIESKLARGDLQLDEIAKHLGVSARTLQRRLSEQDSTFIREVERVRERAARVHVGQNELSFGEIAARLGYADTSAFHRAFKRWTGRTATEFRKAPDPVSYG